MDRDLRRLFSEYLTKFKTMAVATSSKDGIPDCATVYYAVGEDGRIYFATADTTVKYKNLRANPNVALSFTDDGVSSTGLQIRGTAAEVQSKMVAAATRTLLKQRDARIAAFVDRPDVVIFEVMPSERFLINFAWGVDWRNAVPG